MVFYTEKHKLTKTIKGKDVFYLMEKNSDNEENLDETDGFTITKDIRDSFEFPILFENYKGIYISYFDEKNNRKQKSFISKSPNKISCSPLFKLENTLCGNVIDLSEYQDIKDLYSKHNINVKGKTICICKKNIKWNRELLLSQINVYPEYYNEKKIKNDITFYFVDTPMPLIKKYSSSDIHKLCNKCNHILNQITIERTKRVIDDIRNMEKHMIEWVYKPNKEILNVETNVLEFCRKILEME